MKTINKILLMLFTVVAVLSIYTSCTKDSSGTPVVKYVRVTSPGSSDSLLIGAGQGKLIAIMGENLEDAVEVWFNDQKATLTSTYITSTTIIVRVPSQIPLDITNKLKIIFKSGYVLLYDFEVQISKPAVSSMVCEYVKDGEVATILGDYFYEPLTVTFTGGITGEIVEVEDQKVQVKVPAGVQPGPVTVTTNFGETKSNFWFRDNRNIIVHNDPYSGWWGSAYVVDGSDPLAINGNFTRITKNVAEWWDEWIGGPETAISTSHVLPDDAVLSPEKYVMKFEINTIKPYNANTICFLFGQVYPDPASWDNEPYKFQPPFDTHGEWQTVTVPFNEVTANFVTGWGVRPQGYGVKVWFHGPGQLDGDICFDNLRVVPKISQ